MRIALVYLANVLLGNLASIPELIFKKTLLQASFGLVSLLGSEITIDRKYSFSVCLTSWCRYSLILASHGHTWCLVVSHVKLKT